MFFKNFENKILEYEVLFIKWIQVLFGGPENNLLLIKIGKVFTNNIIQNTIISYTILFLTIKFIINNGIMITLFWYSLKEFFKLYGIISISKFINYRIKHFCKIKRPYVEHNNIENITIRKDKSKSYSFPSNSIQNVYVLYYIVLNLVFPNNIYIIYVVYTLVFLIGLIKTLRGLHYLHDIISALIISKLIIRFYLNYIIIL